MPTVSIVKTKDDDYPAIKAAVDEALALIGGLADTVKPGDTVLVKPNLVAVPGSRLSGAVTRWEVCKAVCEAVIDAGGKPMIAESAAVGADTKDVMLFCGYTSAFDEACGIPLLDLKDGTHRPVTLPVKDPVLIDELPTWAPVAEADIIISVPVMKTHDQTEVTLGMKNLKGLIADSEKKAFHSLGVVDGVTDLTKTLKPALTVVDGTYGQEGIGPLFGDTVRMDLIMASKDPVACDAVAGSIMGYEPDEVAITAAAAARGLGEKDLSKILTRGENPRAVLRRFKRAGETEIPGVPPSFHMVKNEAACTGCGNTLISVLNDLRGEGLLGELADKFAVIGFTDASALPGDARPENTILIGKCAGGLKAAGYTRFVPGCPPRNSAVIEKLIERGE